MSTLTLHEPDGMPVGVPLDLCGNADKLAEQTAKRRPGSIVIVWDAAGMPDRSWSFPETTEANA